MTAIADNQLDAILYPHQKRLVVPGADRRGSGGAQRGALEQHRVPCHHDSRWFFGADRSGPDRRPGGVGTGKTHLVGIELLGPAWSEPTLIRLGYAFEQGTHIRRPPPSTPQLP